MTDWKARAEELERECAQSMETIAAERARAEAAEATARELAAHVYYLQNHIGTTEHKNILRDVVLSVSAKEALETVTEWAEAAEARVKELEEALIGADKHAATVEGLLSHHVSWDGITPQGCAQSITVTDEMVDRAEAELDALFSGSPNCTLSDIARASLTAALSEPTPDKPVDEMVERAKKAITETLLALHESDDAWVGEVTSNSLTVDGLVNVERLARAALTAALEEEDAN